MRRCCLLFTLLASACTVGPDYHPPTDQPPPAFKELAGWKPATPADAMAKGDWWAVYHDPALSSLERMVAISNQNVKSYEAQYRNAVALVAEARAGYFPTVTLTPDATQSGGGLHAANLTGSRPLSASGTVSWAPDLWGRVRRQVEGSVANAQVSAADLAGALLSAQATLATDYFNLRAADAQSDLLRQTADAYRRALEITQNQYTAGTAANTDVVTARAQLQSAEAQLVGVGVQRQQYEHAIAMLTGHAPSELSIIASPLASIVPVLPAGLPSALLERRPDIAAAERSMQAQNAQIGVELAGYYPSLTLTASGGLEGNTLGNLFSIGNNVWSLGAQASEEAFSGGLVAAQVAAARATYDQAVATYRQTVLTGFQQVEDALSDLRILQQQAAAEAIAVQSAQAAVEATLNQYRAGTVAYTSVITEQTLLLTDRQSALTIQQSRLVDSVALIQALGGGWTAADLP